MLRDKPVFDRANILNRRRRLEERLKEHIQSEDVLIICAGMPIGVPGGLDQTYPYIPHPDYFWITGNTVPGGVTFYQPDSGWYDFVSFPGASERLWEGIESVPWTLGTEQSLENFEQISNKLIASQKGHIYFLGPYDAKIHSSINARRKAQRQVNLYQQLELQELWNRERRIKDKAEISLIKKTASIAESGYKSLSAWLKSMSARELAELSEKRIKHFYENAVFNAGSEGTPYSTIVGFGSNSAILHASPSNRKWEPNQHILIDAGAQLSWYCCDITRILTPEPELSAQAKAIFEIVNRAQAAGISAAKPGVFWSIVHEAAAHEMAKGLRDLGLISIDPQEFVAAGGIGAFFPHGVGHLVGLLVRDVGGDCRNTSPPIETCGVSLRFNLKLEENFTATVEPGLYFIPPRLEIYRKNAAINSLFNWKEIDKWLNFGGVRIEDDIRIDGNGAENLTQKIPK